MVLIYIYLYIYLYRIIVYYVYSRPNYAGLLFNSIKMRSLPIDGDMNVHF